LKQNSQKVQRALARTESIDLESYETTTAHAYKNSSRLLDKKVGRCEEKYNTHFEKKLHQKGKRLKG